MPSFDNKKRLRFVITLGSASFDSKGDNQITLEGYRSTADIDLAGGIQMGELRAKIYGVSASDMNAITSFAYRVEAVEPNTLVAYAIDGTSETIIYTGNIVRAWPDFNSPPDVFLHIQGVSCALNMIRAVPPRSYSGDIDVAVVMGQIAATMGMTLENNGVDQKLTDVYLDGTGMTQAFDLARMAHIDLYADGKVLAITPPNTPRQQGKPIAAIDNTDKIKALLAQWKIEHDKFAALFKEGEALEKAGDQAGAMEKYKAAKVHNTNAEVLLAQAKALKAQERPASVVGVPLVSPETGLVGYPMYDGVFLTLRTLYNPAIIPGGSIRVESSRDRASGTWQVLSMSHRLEAEKPGGAWFTTVRCVADIRVVTGR